MLGFENLRQIKKFSCFVLKNSKNRSPTIKIAFKIANLNVICERWIEEECVYAIDLLHLNNVKLKGSAMYYAYKSYKGENKSNNVSILETLPVNPNFKEDDIF